MSGGRTPSRPPANEQAAAPRAGVPGRAPRPAPPEASAGTAPPEGPPQVAPAEGAPYASLREGLIVAGKYRLVEVRGEGAMGAVWSANHLTLGHTVAIKFLNVSTMGSPEGRSRFEREARIAARLGEASRHITRVIDHGVLDDGMPYIVMELLQGESLATYVKREKLVPLPRIARIVQHLARALHVAHSAGVVHRDLKPANIFLCQPEPGEDLYVKLLDFGIAKATETDEDRTGNAMFGTPSYMSPEQLSDQPIDARTDLWAVAAIVYRMAAGRPPFGGGPLTEVGFRITSTEPTPPSEINPELPREFDMWVTRGLAKKPAERFQTAGELSDFLAVVAGVSGASLYAAGDFRSLPPAALETTGESARVADLGSDRALVTTGDARDFGARTSGASIAATSAADPGEPVVSTRRSRLAWIAGAAAVGVIVLASVYARPTASTSAASPATSAEAKKPEPIVAFASAPPALPTAASAPPALPSASPTAASAATSAIGAPSATLPARSTPSPSKKNKPTDSSGWSNKKEL